MYKGKALLALVFCFLLLGFFSSATPLQAQEIEQKEYEEWQADWGLPEGFAMEVDTTGYTFPSSMAFVPNPGDAPNDPLYFVAELRGTIKVVTNDRSVHIFAEDFVGELFERGLNDIPDEFGLTGICLSPEHGYLYATMTHQNKKGRFNDIFRFNSVPEKFGLSYSSITWVGQVFEGFQGGFSHVVGPCQVENNLLYVGVGDGYSVNTLPVGPEIPAGKVLRMTLDGMPVPENPFYNESKLKNPANYVWAYGFRNPFGLYVEGEQVFVGDNGGGVDRFVVVEKGEDYLWNGDDLSIGSKNNFSFAPTIGPTQLDYYSGETKLFPKTYDNLFFMGMSGIIRGIINVPNTKVGNRKDGVPEIFLNYLGDKRGDRYLGTVAALKFGPDGLYFAPISLKDGSELSVYKISYDPENEHPFRRNEYTLPEILIENVNCTSCHTLRNRGAGTAPDITPNILVPRITKSLNTPGFENWWREVNEFDDKISKKYTNERNHLLELHGQERAWFWTYYHLLEPRFDNPEAAMPNFGLTEVQAESLANYFIGNLEETRAQANVPSTDAATENANPSIMERLRALRENLPPVGYRTLVIVFLVGGLLGAGTIWLVMRRKLKNRTE